MTIEWNTVTWYSKALAVVLFVGIAVGGFMLGRTYQHVIYEINFGPERLSPGGSLMVPLRVGETGERGDVRLTLDGILQDSRCPTDVACIQAGSVTVVVTLERGIDSKKLHVTTDEARISSLGVLMRITSVTPAPVSTKTIRPDEYRVTFELQERIPPNVTQLIDKAKNATYKIESDTITLKNGISVTPIMRSSDKMTTQYFGNKAVGDLNGDDISDLVFLLTQTTGGSGTFYYVVALLSGEASYQGSNAVFIGDRIAPQSTEIHGGKITVNYADRKVGEGMVESPSVGGSLYLVVKNGQLIKQ